MNRILSLLLLLVATSVFSQVANQHKIDSLNYVLKRPKPDSVKVKLLIELSNQLPYVNPVEGIAKGLQALSLASRHQWKYLVAEAHSAIGGNYANQSDYANALKYEYKALKIYEELGEKREQARMLRNIGIVLHTSNDQKSALEYDNKALFLYQEIGDKLGEAAMYGNIANVYYSLKNTGRGISYNLLALKMYEKAGDLAGVARVTGNIANVYAIEGEFNKAMVYYFDAVAKEDALLNATGVARNLGNIGETYLDIAKADPNEIFHDQFIPFGKKDNLDRALEYLAQSLEMARNLGQVELILAFGEVYADALSLSGNNNEAFKVYKEYVQLSDSVYDQKKLAVATRKQLDYEYGKQQDSLKFEQRFSTIQLQTEKRERTFEKAFLISGLLAIMIFAALMYHRWKFTRKQKLIIEQEKQRSEELLLNILPAETAQELKDTGSARAREYESVTVMFTDFKNFTTLSEKLSSQELVNEINYCYVNFDQIISKYNIEKIKTIGDSYMCAAGLPVANETHASDILNAAIEIRDFMVHEKQRRNWIGKDFFEIRIGCHTGPVVAGIVGTKKFAYDIWGDTVNLASRMESSGEPGKINISEHTYDLVRREFNCQYRGKIQAKNKGEVDMYFVEPLVKRTEQEIEERELSHAGLI